MSPRGGSQTLRASGSAAPPRPPLPDTPHPVPLPNLLGLRGHCLPACPSLPAPVPMWGSSQALPVAPLPPGWDPAALGLSESAPRSVDTPSPRPQLGQAFKAQEAGRSVTWLFWDNRTSCCLHSSGQDSTDSEAGSPLHPVWPCPPPSGKWVRPASWGPRGDKEAHAAHTAVGDSWPPRPGPVGTGPCRPCPAHAHYIIVARTQDGGALSVARVCTRISH